MKKIQKNFNVASHLKSPIQIFQQKLIRCRSNNPKYRPGSWCAHHGDFVGVLVTPVSFTMATLVLVI